MTMTLNIPNTQGSVDKSPETIDSNVNESTYVPNKELEKDYEDNLEDEYYDKRSITISLVHNYSNYRKVNMKVLGQRKETIGSSVRSCQVLSSNADEIAAYFPSLIGISASNPDFLTRVKAWLSNIQFTISENDVALDISFRYKHKKDYIALKVREDKINEEYDKIDRSNIGLIKDGLKKKIDALCLLESERYKYGTPINVENYLIYRHCLLYRDVAKDIALINSDSSIRFYIKDEAKESEKQRKMVHEKAMAMRNFVELSSNDTRFNAVYVLISSLKNDNLAEALTKDKSVKMSIVMDFLNNNPDKFNRILADKNIVIKSFIETLIARGELVRSEFNQQISTADGMFVGSNMNEAIAWFENPANAAVKAAYENKLKLY